VPADPADQKDHKKPPIGKGVDLDLHKHGEKEFKTKNEFHFHAAVFQAQW